MVGETCVVRAYQIYLQLNFSCWSTIKIHSTDAYVLLLLSKL